MNGVLENDVMEALDLLQRQVSETEWDAGEVAYKNDCNDFCMGCCGNTCEGTCGWGQM